LHIIFSMEYMSPEITSYKFSKDTTFDSVK
jgi:hypothetical protein